MKDLVYLVTGVAAVVACCLACGRFVISTLALPLKRQEMLPLSFLLGAPVLSLAVFLLCAAGIVHRGVLLCLQGAILAAAWRGRLWRSRAEPLAPVPGPWAAGLAMVFTAFGVYYLVNAMAPEISPDGTAYRLSHVARYYREHGFGEYTTDFYAFLSGGIDMLFLAAWPMGKHSAASMIHFAFLLALSRLMICYGQRHGMAAPASAAAAIVFCSPLAGIDGTSAYNDVAVMATVFALFYLAEALTPGARARQWLAVGLLAGFCYALKYTAFVAVPYAVFRAWKGAARGPRVMMVLAAASLSVLPWMIKNMIVAGNPLAPFFNDWFLNPYVLVSFERQYLQSMRSAAPLASAWQVPFDVIAGGVGRPGILGPAFLLAPAGLLALGDARGRRLLAAAVVFAFAIVTNYGGRFLMPAMPFLALAMATVLTRARLLLALVVLAHAVSSWPPVLGRWVDSGWQVREFPWRAAMRMGNPDAYLSDHSPTYGAARLVEANTPPGARVYSQAGIAEAYTSRDIVTGYRSTLGIRLTEALWMAVTPESQPAAALRFVVPRGQAYGVRIEQTATPGTGLEWMVTEVRVSDGGTVYKSGPGWTLAAQPFPWNVSDAFDDNVISRWRSSRPAERGMRLEARFPQPMAIDTVDVLHSRQQTGLAMRLWLLDGAGRWEPADGTGQPLACEVQDLRAAATSEFLRLGVRYALFDREEQIGGAIARDPALWGLSEIGRHAGTGLYEVISPSGARLDGGLHCR